MTVSDTLPTGLTPGTATGTGWTCGTVAQTVTCSRSDVLSAGATHPAISIPVTVEQTVAGGTGVASLTNTATVSGGGETNTTNSSVTDPTNINSSADVSIDKTGSISATPGTNINYTIKVDNAGPSDAVNVTVTDPVPVGLTLVSVTGDCTSFPCNFTRMSPATSKNITVTYTIPGAYTTPDPIVNIANVSSVTPDPSSTNNSAKANTSLGSPIADLGLTKTDFPASSTAIPGTPITYKIIVTNAGPSAATGATVVDTFPATITGVNWTCTASTGSSCPASGAGNINAIVNVLNAGTLTFTATGNIAANATGILVNNATVTPPAGTSDPSSNNNDDTNTLVPQADLSVVKTGPANIVPGTNVTYTVTVKNLGPSNAESVDLSDPTPAGLVFFSNTGDCTTAYPCSFGTLAPNATKVIATTYSVPSNYDTATSVTNTATVSSPTADPQANNNSSSITLGSNASADLSLTKTVDNTSPAVGQNVTYTITLTNAGPSAATGVSVKEQLPAGLSLISSNPATGSFNAGVWTVGDLSVGSTTLMLTARVDVPGALTNTAEVSALSTPDPDSTPNDGTGDDAASASLTARVPDLTTTKTHTGNFTRGLSGVYTLSVTNSGTATTAGLVSVTDTLPIGLTPSSATGTGWTCSISGQVVTCSRLDALTASSSYPDIQIAVLVAQDAAASLTNTSSVSGGGEVNTANNTASDPTTIVSSSDLASVKTPPSSIVPGENAVFSIKVTNAGPSDAKNALGFRCHANRIEFRLEYW
jgi:uncharacterized repeat protein (TIGR01451 family)